MSDPPTGDTIRRQYMVVVVMPDRDMAGRQTGRVNRSLEQAKLAQDRVVAYLDTAGVDHADYTVAEPSAVGTFAMEATEAVVRVVRRAPGVEAVLEA